MRFPFDKLFQGNAEVNPVETAHSGWQTAFRHYHYYSFPALYMLDMFIPMNCNPGGYVDLDAMYLSEVDPTWNHDELAFFTNPEMVLFATALTTISYTSPTVLRASLENRWRVFSGAPGAGGRSCLLWEPSRLRARRWRQRAL